MLTFVYYIDVFLTRPGYGEHYVYSPVGVNATLYCVVEATILFWGFNGTNYNTGLESSLNPRGIYFKIIPTTSAGITESYIKVFGNKEVNNNTSICCRSITGAVLNRACTILILYGMLYEDVWYLRYLICKNKIMILYYR